MATATKTTTHTAQIFQIDPFDIVMHATESGVRTLQSRISSWLSTLNSPARFISYQLPATLEPKIDQVKGQIAHLSETDPTNNRVELLGEYRRFYDDLERQAAYQRSLCYMTLWSEDNPGALAGTMSTAFDTSVRPTAELQPLFDGQYILKRSPFWHLAPVGRPGGRLLWSILTSYEFLPSTWNFFDPLEPLLKLGFPLALAVDIDRTFDRNEAIDTIESNIMAYTTHLSGSHGEDSRAVQRVKDCRSALNEINQGDALHLVQFSLAISAPSTALLRARTREVINRTRAWLKFREEDGVLLQRAVSFFTSTPTKQIDMHLTPWPVTSRELAVMLAPVGYRKLNGTRGVMRGEAVGRKGSTYPFFHDSWNDKRGNPEKRATHEIWVGQTGFGKTFLNNCYLSREWVEYGIAFDLLEPMGHGKHLARALGLDWFVLSAQRTKLNPQDVMFDRLIEQKSHVIRVYETVLGRPLTGTQEANLERGLLGQALDIVYSGYPDLSRITPDQAPTTSVVVGVLAGLGDKDRNRQIARRLADEIDSLCCGTGPFADLLNGQTNIDLSFRAKGTPRIFSFHEMEGDPILQAIAYTQVLSAIRRDSLADETPRIIAVDEVYRLMRHPSLLDFLIEAVKTFRTRRKKVICIDQQMSVFMDKKARLVFENCPIRVIFNQRQGVNVFHEDQAFRHFNQTHLQLIAELPRFNFMLDIQDEGVYALRSRPSEAEMRRFNST